MGYVWVLSDSIEKLMENWSRGSFRGKRGLAWNLIPAVVYWSIWKKEMQGSLKEE